MRNVILLLCLLTILSACAPSSSIEPTPTATLTQPATATPTSLPTATPTPTPTPLPLGGQQSQYFIDATINYYNRVITATSRVIYTNKSNVPINEMVFIIYPAIFQAYSTRSIAFGDGTPITDYRWESHRMIIPLAAPLLPGQQIDIVYEYDLYMPDREGVFGQTGRQLLLSYWYPTIPPFDEEEGWQTYEFSMVNGRFVGEHLFFESADFSVNISFTDRQENMVVAAGSQPVIQNDTYQFFQPLARMFTLAISDSYRVIERQVDGILLRGYTLPEVEESNTVAVDIAEKALMLYAELFGPYERDTFSVVQVDMDMNMEFDGMVFIQSSFYWLFRNPPRSDLHIIVPHEVSHQWFFSLVGNNQATEPWLDEAIATYAEALFYERYYPEHLEWWWNERIFAHLPTGTIDTTIFLPGGKPEYMLRVYRRGAQFYQDLRETIGDEAFFDFLLDYVQSHRYEIVSGDDFWNTLSRHTNENLDALFDSYFSTRPNYP